MYGCQQVLISPGSELKAILEFVCGESNKLANCGIYYARQLYFKTGKTPGRAELHRLLKTNPHFKALYSHVAQQTLTSVAESFSSFIGLLKGIAKGTVEQRPRIPSYKKNALKLVTFPRVDVKLKDDLLRFPLGSKVKAWFGVDAFYLPMPSNLDYKSLREIRILPRNGCFYAEFVYTVEPVVAEVDSKRCLGVDHGLGNWLTCVSNCGTSFIVDGLHLKSLNQFYNKQVATFKKQCHRIRDFGENPSSRNSLGKLPLINMREKKPQGFWSNKLAAITEKRNRQMRDAVNKAARLVINHCIDNRIGVVVFG